MYIVFTCVSQYLVFASTSLWTTLYWPEHYVYIVWALITCHITPPFPPTLPKTNTHTYIPGSVFGAGEPAESSSLAQPPPPPPEPPSWHLWEGPYRTPGSFAAREGNENYQVLAHLPHWTPARYGHVDVVLYLGHCNLQQDHMMSILHETQLRYTCRYTVTTRIL